MSAAFRVAAAQYDIGALGSWAVYEAKIRQWVANAASGGAQLLVFPEYFSMELASLYPEAIQKSLSHQLDAVQELLPAFERIFTQQSREHGVHIVAGSFPVRLTDGRFCNRAFLFQPDGQVDYQDKLQMTRFEKEQWFISAGESLKVFDTALGRIGINICYDSEFPLLARQQVEAGADVILVPSCTDTLAGY